MSPEPEPPMPMVPVGSVNLFIHTNLCQETLPSSYKKLPPVGIPALFRCTEVAALMICPFACWTFSYQAPAVVHCNRSIIMGARRKAPPILGRAVIQPVTLPA